MVDDQNETPPSTLPTGAPSPHASWLLTGSDFSSELLPSVVCQDCPASLWYATLSGLRCYCNTYRMHTWGGDTFDIKKDPVMACDGRELAIMQMLEAQAKAAGPM